MAARYGVLEELERACRRQAFIDWEVYGAPGRLFVNTIPATVRDASFLGRGVLDYLGSRISPDLVTLEITEREVIENLALYRDAMQSFIELGFSFAIDDLGSGHSGLDTVAQLGVSYLKIDLKLVRDLHLKPANRQVIKAILEMAEATGATPIAEGIEQPAEVEVLAELGIRWGQGYYFSKVLDPYAPRTQPPPDAFTPVAKIDLGPRDA
jgi:EAL domain-containing protein (putative c-di-GMP-specific phosphodiesterase class I)